MSKDFSDKTKENNNTLFVDSKGLQEIEQALKQARERLKEVTKSKKEVFYTEGNEWLWFSSDLDAKESDERLILEEIKTLESMISRIEIVERGNDSETIDINDVVEVGIKFDNEYDEMTIKLVGAMTDINKDIMDVSINSPLGSAIYKKKVGETNSYKAADQIRQVTIIKKYNNLEENITRKRESN